MVQAILTTNNAYDTVLLANGTALTVTNAVFADLISAELEIGNWHGTEDWSGHGEDVESAAVAYGDVVAKIVDGKLTVVDQAKFDQCKLVYNA